MIDLYFFIWEPIVAQSARVFKPSSISPSVGVLYFKLDRVFVETLSEKTTDEAPVTGFSP
jgi:hypothetical protein